MNRKIKKTFLLAVVLLAAFVLFTVFVANFDVKPIGPEGSSVGFAGLNGAVFAGLGTNQNWYRFTEILGYGAFLCPAGFAAAGFCQFLRRKSLRRVDKQLLLLGAFYLVVIACYLFFEQVVINCRPILTESGLEPSYPSSHTMLTACIAASAAVWLSIRFANRKRLCAGVEAAAVFLSVLMAAGRLFAGVHWFTDVTGSLLLSAALAAFYSAAAQALQEKYPAG